MICLICGEQIVDLNYGPYCFERCQLIDLYNWLAEEND
jgi:endogenous inhibitor of DNA gyrase (YacG/DUF329 family)